MTFLTQDLTVIRLNLNCMPELLEALKEKHLLSDAMISDIMQYEDRQSRNDKLLQFIHSKLALGEDELKRRLIEVFQHNGHSLLADYLAEKAEDSVAERLLAHISHKLPKLNANLTSEDKRLLHLTVEDQIRKSLVSEDWRKRHEAKQKVMDSRIRELEFSQKTQLDHKNLTAEIKVLRSALKAAQAETDSKKRYIEKLQAQVQDMQAKHREQVKRLTIGSVAQNSSIHKLSDDVHSAINDLKELTDRMRIIMKDFVEPDTESPQGYVRSIRRNVDKLIFRQADLERNNEKFASTKKEIYLLLERLGISKEDMESTNLIDAFEQFVQLKDKAQKEVVQIYRDQRSKELQNVLTKVQIDELKSDLAEKNKQIAQLVNKGHSKEEPTPKAPVYNPRRRYSIAVDNLAQLPHKPGPTGGANKKTTGTGRPIPPPISEEAPMKREKSVTVKERVPAKRIDLSL